MAYTYIIKYYSIDELATLARKLNPGGVYTTAYVNEAIEQRMKENIQNGVEPKNGVESMKLSTIKEYANNSPYRGAIFSTEYMERRCKEHEDMEAYYARLEKYIEEHRDIKPVNSWEDYNRRRMQTLKLLAAK